MPLKPKPLEREQDNFLMKQVQDGDLSKMGVLFEQYHGELFGYFYRMTNDPAQSEDLVQNVFYRLLKYRHSFQPDGKFMYWIYGVAKNVFLDLYKKNNPLRHSQDIQDVKEVSNEEKNKEEQMVSSERKELLREALQRISPEQRQAIILSKFQGLKYQEIAVIANCTENAIKARVRRGLTELRNLLDH